MIFTNGIRQRLTLLALASVTVLTAMLIASWTVYQGAKINGPLYNDVVGDKDFVADILPPPAFVIEAVLTAHQYPGLSATERGKVKERLTGLHGDFDASWAKWLDRVQDAEVKALAQKARDSGRVVWEVITGQVVRLMDDGNLDESRSAVARQLMAAYNPHRDDIQILADQLDKRVKSYQTRIDALEHRSSWTFVLIGLAALLVVIIGTWRSAWAIIRPLQAVTRNVDSGISQVSAAAGQVSESSQRLSQGASSQASSLEETSASLEQLAANTRQNADNARQADTLAQEANRTAVKGESEARRIAGEVAGHLAQLGEAVAAIRKSTEQTKQVVATIDEIAFQTNLLALNAAVEAARAGEAGMGFAVVADEVRNLAQRSTEEVKNTTELMKQAQAATTRVMEVTVTVEGYLKNAVGDQMVSSFKQVVDGTGKVTHLMAEVSTASDEQAKGVEQINRAIAEMDKVTQENAASAEESAAASEELNAQASEMQHSVDDLTKLVEGSTGSTGSAAHSRATLIPPPSAARTTVGLPRRTTASLNPATPRRTTQTMPAADRPTRKTSEILPLTDAEQQGPKDDLSRF